MVAPASIERFSRVAPFFEQYAACKAPIAHLAISRLSAVLILYAYVRRGLQTIASRL